MTTQNEPDKIELLKEKLLKEYSSMHPDYNFLVERRFTTTRVLLYNTFKIFCENLK